MNEVGVSPRKFDIRNFIVFLFVLFCTLFLLVCHNYDVSGENTLDPRYYSGFGGSYVDVEFEDPYLFAVNDQSFHIFDVSDPADPQEIGRVRTEGSASGINLQGDLAYVADGENGLVIIDISDKGNPIIIGQHPTSHDANDIDVLDDHAYIAVDDDGLTVMNISRSDNIHIVDEISLGWGTMSVLVNSGFVYVSDYINGIYIIDVSDLENIHQVGQYDTEGNAREAAIRNDLLYVADGSKGLVILDVSDGDNPSLKGSIDTNRSALGVTISGDYAFIADESDGLYIIDITDPENPSIVESLDTDGYAKRTVFDDPYVYVADGNAGFAIINVVDLENPSITGQHTTAGYVRGAVVQGDYAFLGADTDGLMILDISNQLDPQLISRLPMPGPLHHLEVVGDYLYIAVRSFDFLIVDVTDKRNPEIVGSIESGIKSFDFIVDGDFVYMKERGDGLAIIDVSDRSNPNIVGTYSIQTPGGGEGGIDVHGNYAFMTDNYKGLFIIDISDKENPTLTGQYETSGMHGIQILNDIAFISSSKDGLEIYNVSEKDNPTFVSDYDTGGNSWNLHLRDDFLYVMDLQNGLVVLNISDASDPKMAGRHDTSGTAQDVDVAGNFAYLSDYYGGFIIVELAPRAWIDDITPTIAKEGDTYQFWGHGTDESTIVRYAWSSSIDGEFHNDTQCYTTTNMLSNGTHAISLFVQDNHGAWSEPDVSFITVNGIPRTKILGISPNPGTEGDEFSFDGEATDDGDIIRYVWSSSIDGEFWNISYPIDPQLHPISDLSNGSHTISFRVQDSYRDWSDTTTSTLTINGRPRSKIISFPEDQPYLGQDVNFIGEGTDDGVVVAYFWSSSLDGTLYDGPQPSFSCSNLTLGVHTISFRVIDDLGIPSDWSEKKLIVHQRPIVQIDESGPGSVLSTDTVQMVAHSSDDGHVAFGSWESSIDGPLDSFNSTEFFLTTDDQLFGDPGDEKPFWVYADYNVIPEGKENRREVNAGVWTSEPFTEETHLGDFIRLRIWFQEVEEGDTNDPIFRLILKRGNEVIIEDEIQVFENSAEPKLIDLETMLDHELVLEAEDILELTVNYTGWVDCKLLMGNPIFESTLTFSHHTSELDVSDLTLGTHTITCTVMDNYGAWSEQATRTIVVHERPIAEIISLAPEPAIVGQSVLFTAQGTDDGEINSFSWTSSLDGELFNGSEASFTWAGLTPGTHTITLKVEDTNGAWSEEVSTEIAVLSKPSVTISDFEKDPVSEGDTIRFGAIVVSDHPVTLYIWTSSVDGEFYNGSEAEFDFRDLSEGEHQLSVRIQNDQGIWSDDASGVITVEGVDDDPFFLMEPLGPLPIVAYGILVIVVLIGVSLSIMKSAGSASSAHDPKSGQGVKGLGSVPISQQPAPFQPQVPSSLQKAAPPASPPLPQQPVFHSQALPPPPSLPPQPTLPPQPVLPPQYLPPPPAAVPPTAYSPPDPSPSQILIQPDGTWICPTCGNRPLAQFAFCTSCGFKRSG